MRNDLLEYSTLKQHIMPYISSDTGMDALNGMSPFDSWKKAKARWAMLDDMIGLIGSVEPPNFVTIADIRPLLDIHEGATLEGQDIIKVAGSLKDIAKIKYELGKNACALMDIARGIEPLDGLSSAIQERLLPTGEVSEQTNPVLKDLRKKYRSVRASILEKLENIIERLRDKSVLMEDIVTKRNDRYVIPMRHDYSSQIKGITHDYSRTNRSVYVEPMDVVNENNTLNQLSAYIKDEEYKVLSELSQRIYKDAGVIKNNMYLYGLLDLIHACARWSIKTDGSIPRICDDNVSLTGARHPLLLERLGGKTVPLDIHIPKGNDCLIISGPNAGGKTVALKTLGLLTIMAKTGLAIPAGPDSEIPAIGDVWVEMDTNQDITHDLSSFTAHALALKHIYENVKKGDLVLLDEPGGGTDHEHGSAIAVACIDGIRKKGAYVGVTSHSDIIKLYGVSSEGVENAATAFDDTGLKPLFTLQYGVIGQSRAFEILESIEFPQELINEACSITNHKGSTSLSRAMEDLSKTSAMKNQAEKELAEAARYKTQAEEIFKEMERERVNQSLRYKRLIDRVELMTRQPRPKEEVESVKETVEAIELVDILDETAPAEVLEIKKGCTVMLKGSNTTGKVLDILHDSAEVILGNKRLKVGLDQIEAIETETQAFSTRKNAHVSAARLVLPIKVVGMRVDEALPVVAKALDQALLSGQERLEIIHGAGTGKLKKAIRQYLNGITFVKRVHDAPIDQGGGNKTIVDFNV